MSLLQTQLNRAMPVGQVFQGSGETDPRDKGLRFYQHGLYFNADGSLARDNPHNAEKIALIESLGTNPEAPAPEIQAPDRVPVNPEIVAKLEGSSDEDIFAIANRMVEALKAQDLPFDFTPAVDTRDENVRFIAQYAS